ncbi:unnamed protein product [Ixodes pacificus]
MTQHRIVDAERNHRCFRQLAQPNPAHRKPLFCGHDFRGKQIVHPTTEETTRTRRLSVSFVKYIADTFSLCIKFTKWEWGGWGGRAGGSLPPFGTLLLPLPLFLVPPEVVTWPARGRRRSRARPSS